MFEKLKEGREIAQFQNKWINIMSNLGKFNKMKQTYSLNNVVKTQYGYKADILIVDGLRFKELEDIKDTIEDNYGCMCVLNKNKRSNVVYADFIFAEPNKDKYSVITGLKPWEVYLGNGYNGEPIIIDMIKYPHILITGGTRSGKSKMTDCIITGLICNCSIEELELYLSQVAKSDLILYEDVKQCRAFADTLEKTLTMLQHLDKKMEDRDKLIRPYRKKAQADNYQDYNKINKGNKLSTVFVVFDEMSSLFQTKGDCADIKSLKEEIVRLIRRIAQFGASLGVFLICSLQRPTVDNLDPFIKSQSTCIISFRQNNSKSSEVATDDATMALGLEQREFVYKTNLSNYGIVPLVDNKNIYSFIEPSLQPNHRNIFTSLKKCEQSREKLENKLIEIPKIKTPKATPVEYTKIKTQEEILKENISMIPNFVPYTPLEGLKIIDQTSIPMDTEKPKKV